MLGTKLTDFLMQQQLRLSSDDGPSLDDPDQYRQLLGCLIYLTISGPDIAYSIHILTQFMQSLHQPRLDVIHCILCYLKGSPG